MKAIPSKPRDFIELFYSECEWCRGTGTGDILANKAKLKCEKCRGTGKIKRGVFS